MIDLLYPDLLYGLVLKMKIDLPELQKQLIKQGHSLEQRLTHEACEPHESHNSHQPVAAHLELCQRHLNDVQDIVEEYEKSRGIVTCGVLS